MLLGVVIHSCYIFSTYNWRISSNVHLSEFTAVIDFIHSFRMESFYIIAGFFSMLVLKKYSLKYFIQSRLVRLGIPLLFCGLTLNILMFGYSYTNDFSLASLGKSEFWMNGLWLGHLWFLANLIGYSGLLYVFINVKFPTFSYKKNQYWIFIIVVVAAQLLLSRLSWRIPSEILKNKFLVFDINKFILYAPFFWIGIKLFTNKELFEKLLEINIFNSLVVLSYWIFSRFDINSYLFEVLSALYGLSFTCILFSIFRYFFDKKNAFIESVSDASYTIYLIHQPFIVLWGIVVLGMDLPYWVQFAIILVPAWLLPYLFHRYVVRESRMLMFLFNGKKIKQ